MLRGSVGGRSLGFPMRASSEMAETEMKLEWVKKRVGDTALNDGSRLFLRMSFYKGLWEDAEGTGVGGKIKAEKLSDKRDFV